MTNNTNPSQEDCITTYYKYINEKNPKDLYAYRKRWDNIYEKIFSDDKLQIKDWRYYLLGYYVLSKEKEEEYKTRAFIDLSAQVDKFLKDSYKDLKVSSENEINRKKNMYKDISIPCSNLNGSYQSIEVMIKNFFFCLYAAYQIIIPYQTKEFKDFDERSEEFFNIFEQKICFHPSTVKRFFIQKFPESEDIKYMNNKYKSEISSLNIEAYVKSIEKTKDELCELFIGFIQRCDDLFFILLCRWYEIFLKSIICIPSPHFVNVDLVQFVTKKIAGKQTCKQLLEIIKKDPIYKILSDISMTSIFLIKKIIDSFKGYNPIIQCINVDASDKAINAIQSNIDNLLKFEYEENVPFSPKDDYEFTPEIAKHICDSFNQDNANRKTKRYLKKNNVASMIKTSLIVITAINQQE